MLAFLETPIIVQRIQPGHRPKELTMTNIVRNPTQQQVSQCARDMGCSPKTILLWLSQTGAYMVLTEDRKLGRRYGVRNDTFNTMGA